MRFCERKIFPWLVGAVVFAIAAGMHQFPLGRLLLLEPFAVAGLISDLLG